MSKQLDTCDVVCINPLRVNTVKGSMPDESIFQNLAQTFKVLADPSRVKIIYALSVTELCVCDLAQVVGLSVSATSHQLALLRRMNFVKSWRDGKIVYYSLNDAHIERLFYEGLSHAKSEHALAL